MRFKRLRCVTFRRDGFCPKSSKQKMTPLKRFEHICSKHDKEIVQMGSKRLRGATLRRGIFCTKSGKQKTTPLKRFEHIFPKHA